MKVHFYLRASRIKRWTAKRGLIKASSNTRVSMRVDTSSSEATHGRLFPKTWAGSFQQNTTSAHSEANCFTLEFPYWISKQSQKPQMSTNTQTDPQHLSNFLFGQVLVNIDLSSCFMIPDSYSHMANEANDPILALGLRGVVDNVNILV